MEEIPPLPTSKNKSVQDGLNCDNEIFIDQVETALATEDFVLWQKLELNYGDAEEMLWKMVQIVRAIKKELEAKK